VSSTQRRAALAALVAALAAAGIVVPGLGDSGSEPQPSPAAESAAIPADERAEIERVLTAIDAGAPLPYEEDGGTFQNREGRLPDRPLGYYREYTVATPGSPDRGARRLVIGESGEIYYTNDHYESFTELDREEFR
jgi:ribonuclease T1